jgi:microcystin-dependent protein
MADPFVAEIRVFPFNFAPFGWAFCNGQILPLSQYTALFALLGTTYGGNGISNFALPNMQGNMPVGQGTGQSVYDLGQTGGTSAVTLLLTEMAAHSHNLMATEFPEPASQSPSNAALGFKVNVTNIYSASTTPLAQFAGAAIMVNGSSQPHNNVMPYLTLNFCIALQGVFPTRG